MNPTSSQFFFKHKGEFSFFAVLSGLIGTSVVVRLFPEWAPLWMGVLQTGFEAGTVGGAADWLAVKMIFDEIKIGRWRIVPASGIIPRKQKAIAQGAGKLVANEWLSRESIGKMLSQIDVSDAMAEMLASMHRKGETTALVRWLMNKFFEFLEQPAMQEKLSALAKEKLADIRISRWIGQHLNNGRVRELMNRLIPFLADKFIAALSTKEAYDLIYEKMAEERGGFFKQLFFDPADATDKTIIKLTRFLEDIQYDEFHPLRERLNELTLDWAQKLMDDRSTAAVDVNELGRGLIQNVDTEAWIQRMIQNIRNNFDDQIRSDESVLNKMIREGIERLIGRLKSDAELKSEINRKILNLVGELLARHHHRIGEMVEENILRLSPEAIKEQFKSRTYDDMQWIRVNGAVAGFAIGIVIGLIRALF
ncbi:DUF445 domain-containing protein [bacterium]|nr:DUF445 domain-containing protein [bacterium]